MPVGPSHRGRSSSSSSRSSSSSSRSSYSSSSRSGGRSYSRSYSSYSGSYYGGSSVEIHLSPKGWAIFGIILGFIASIVMAIVGVAKLSNNISYHALMRRDAREYLEIIEKAENGEEGYYIKHIDGLFVSGSSTSGGLPTEYRLKSNGTESSWRDDTYIDAYTEVRKSGINYYWYEIEFYSEELDTRISAITYSYYAESQVAGMSSLTLVYTKAYDGDGSWDVIQKDYSLDKNMDYWYAGNQILIGVILVLLGGGLATLMVWCCIKVHNHGKKKEETTPTPTQSIADKFKECAYCGSQVRIDNTSCSVCGARKFNKIKKSDG